MSDIDGKRELTFAGRLDAYSIAGVWPDARAALDAAPAVPVLIETSRVEYCDGGGIAMLVDLLRQSRRPEAQVAVIGLKPQFKTLLDQFDPAALRALPKEHVERLHAVAEIGRAALIVGRDMRVQIAFIGETSAALWFAITHPHRIRWKDVWYTCEQVGVNALPIVALISFLLGIILAFQSAVPMRQFGAEIFVADLVGLSILRELGPLMTAILLAGRSGAAFAAEIGTMKVNEELNALTTMGLDPVRFLVVTRIIAAFLMMPLLCIFADLIGILGGALTMISSIFRSALFTRSIVRFTSRPARRPRWVFADPIAGIGCPRRLERRPCQRRRWLA